MSLALPHVTQPWFHPQPLNLQVWYRAFAVHGSKAGPLSIARIGYARIHTYLTSTAKRLGAHHDMTTSWLVFIGLMHPNCLVGLTDLVSDDRAWHPCVFSSTTPVSSQAPPVSPQAPPMSSQAHSLCLFKHTPCVLSSTPCAFSSTRPQSSQTHKTKGLDTPRPEVRSETTPACSQQSLYASSVLQT